MKCDECKYCQYPRSSNDNWGNCKCKAMKRKTIDIYVAGGETPIWCPLKKMPSCKGKTIEQNNISRQQEMVNMLEKLRERLSIHTELIQINDYCWESVISTYNVCETINEMITEISKEN